MIFDLNRFLNENIFIYFDTVKEWEEFCDTCEAGGIENPCRRDMHGGEDAYIFNYGGSGRVQRLSYAMESEQNRDFYCNIGYAFINYKDMLLPAFDISSKDLFDLISEG